MILIRHLCSMDCTGLYLAVLGCTGLYWAVLGCTGLYWAVLGCTGLYLALLSHTRSYSALLGLTGPYYALIGLTLHLSNAQTHARTYITTYWAVFAARNISSTLRRGRAAPGLGGGAAAAGGHLLHHHPQPALGLPRRWEQSSEECDA